MSLVNAVHALLDVAAGRRNLSAEDADRLHDEIDGVEPAPEPEPEPAPPTAEELAAYRAWAASQHAAEAAITEVPGA